MSKKLTSEASRRLTSEDYGSGITIEYIKQPFEESNGFTCPEEDVYDPEWVDPFKEVSKDLPIKK